MELKKYRWSKTYEAAEVDLGELLASKSIEAERLDYQADQELALGMHAKDKRIWCAEGSIMITINSTQKIALQAGDALNIPAFVPHQALAGFAGSVCYESPLPAQNPSIAAK